MKSEIKYIELKTGYSDNGPAWIGIVSFSKTGRTLYFDGKAFQSLNGNGISGNYYEIESGDEYWISGVKKNQNDRHLSGGGKINIEKRVLSEYLQIINQTNLKEKDYDIIEVEEEIPTARINDIENQKHESESGIDINKRFLKPTEMTNDELKYFIDYYKDHSINGTYLKGRKNSRNTMNELIAEKENRKKKP
ncbi:hypothetical protein K0U91_14090 [Chryseobacterium chendengshani]|uniref:hypothetical protein n=1 Tax=Chryseobacterium sp. LJ668 TaxID=2864040 RepID=UPI001C68A39F|nr:hypothetical protein [Chryseobacterium sp. LJ668]MBW8522636.1 hypothetical protein [Chryseobacterium sp. LJ668]QYK16173.1 hypothetical protein K0U91_14090 [Chryseobacterium sp. LJ668]